MRYLVIMSFALLISNSTLADSSYNRGKEKSVTCSACHGTDGNSDNKMYPRLSGQYKIIWSMLSIHTRVVKGKMPL